MELRHLRYFVTVAEEGTFVGAAKRLNLVQQALSKQVADLERELGVQLFERLPRGVRLTEPGRVLQKEALILLEDARRALDRVHRAARGEVGRVTVGFVESSAWSTELTGLFREFRERVPAVTLEMTPMSSVQQWSALHERRIDIGFVYQIPQDAAGVGRLHVADEETWLAVPCGHPLADRKDLRLQDLTDVPFISFPRTVSPVYFDAIMRACHEGGLALRVVQEAPNIPTMLSLVAAGMGAAFMNSVARHRKPDSVALIRVEDFKVPVSLDAVWLERNDAPALRAFVDLIASVLRSRTSRLPLPPAESFLLTP